MPKVTLSFKGLVMDVYHLERAETCIGRDEGCDIHIDSLAIAPRGAMIRRIDDDSYQIEALDDAFPLLVNREPVKSATPLRHGDIIQVGKHTLAYAEDVMELGAGLGSDLRQAEENDRLLHDSGLHVTGMLQIMNGENFGRIIPLKRNMTRIGHVGGDCAMISKRDNGYYLSFLEGSNPPVVNRHPIGNESHHLDDGDIIEIGGTKMQFHE